MIIPLGRDSDEESDSEEKTGAPAPNFLGNLDQFLLNVRHDVEKQVRASHVL